MVYGQFKGEKTLNKNMDEVLYHHRGKWQLMPAATLVFINISGLDRAKKKTSLKGLRGIMLKLNWKLCK